MTAVRNRWGEELRAKVVAAARAQIARGGTAKFSLRTLSAETGIARSTLHRRFGGREALLAAILAEDAAALSGLAQSAAPQIVLRRRVGGAPEPAGEIAGPPPDAWLERRLRVFERALGTLEARQEKFEREKFERENSAPASRAESGEAFHALAERLAAAETRIAEIAVETARLAALRPPERLRPAPLADARMAEPELPFIAPEPEPNPEEAPATVLTPMRDVIADARARAARAVPAEEETKNPNPRRFVLVLALAILIVGAMLANLAFFTGRALSPMPQAGVAHRHVAATASGRLVALADSGEAVAQYALGTHYLESDPRAGLRWLNAAAVQGNRKAMHNLAVAYALGKGTPADPAMAARWFARAAALGYVDSAFDLAVLYERGEGVQQSLAAACKWYMIAAAAGDAPSAARIEALRGLLSAADFAAARAAAASFAPARPDPAANFAPLPPGI